MTTVQIVSIAVAAAILLALVVALVVTRRRDARDEPAERSTASFLDEAPQDTLERLGKAERRPEPAAPSTESGAPAAPAAAGDAQGEGDLGLDWGPSGDATMALPPADARRAPEPDDAEVTGELPVVVAPAGGATPNADLAVRDESAAAAPQGPAEERTETPAGPPAEPAAPAGRRVPLSDIIVTTSTKLVDLDDPEVRRMLTDLVTFEIDQATQYRQHGQDIDAVLQLTEAEKIARALGMDETAQRIRDMIGDLHA